MITNMQPLRMESVLHVANERFGQSPTNISSGRSSSIKFFCVNYMIFNFHSVSLFTKVKLIVKKKSRTMVLSSFSNKGIAYRTEVCRAACTLCCG